MWWSFKFATRGINLDANAICLGLTWPARVPLTQPFLYLPLHRRRQLRRTHTHTPPALRRLVVWSTLLLCTGCGRCTVKQCSPLTLNTYQLILVTCSTQCHTSVKMLFLIPTYTWQRDSIIVRMWRWWWWRYIAMSHIRLCNGLCQIVGRTTEILN